MLGIIDCEKMISMFDYLEESEDWDGTYLGVEDPPSLTYNFYEMLRFMRDNNKNWEDLTEEEIEMFRIPGR